VPKHHGGELALDPPVSPGWVLLCQLDDERSGSRGDGRLTGPTVWVGPALGDEVTVSAQQGGRLDEAPSLAKAREQSHQAGQYGPVGRLQCRTVDLASEYRDLVAQHDDLDCEVAVLAAGEPDQLEDANERPVQEREGHRRIGRIRR
jgi:hypothetical protein